MRERQREREREEWLKEVLLVTHFPPCSESLDELVLEPEPDELESSSSESSILSSSGMISIEAVFFKNEQFTPSEPELGRNFGLTGVWYSDDSKL